MLAGRWTSVTGLLNRTHAPHKPSASPHGRNATMSLPSILLIFFDFHFRVLSPYVITLTRLQFGA